MDNLIVQHILEEGEITFEFIRASGPGGQNVNKVATAVQLRWNINSSPTLQPEVRERLRSLAGKRMTIDGTLVIMARRFRTQDRNRQDAMEKLNALVNEAIYLPAVRHPTRPTLASRENRLQTKKSKSRIKTNRKKFHGESE